MINNQKVVAIIQGRMNSSRLPGKVLLDINGKPMLLHVIDRVRQAALVDEIVVATTTDSSDDEIGTFCQNQKVACYRGSLQDVLDRYYQSARLHHADIIVRITADCPLVDPMMIDEVIRERDLHIADFCSNRLPPPFKRTYPIGLDIEVVTFKALALAWQKAVEKHQREHVLPYLYEIPGQFKVHILNYKKDLSNIRITVDTPEDLEVIRKITAHFGGKMDYSWLEVVDYYLRNKDLSKLNAGIQHKTYLDVDHRKLKTQGVKND